MALRVFTGYAFLQHLWHSRVFDTAVAWSDASASPLASHVCLQGIAAPLYGAMAENAIIFLAYGEAKRALSAGSDQPLSLTNTALAGAFAGLVVSFWLTPVVRRACTMMNHAGLTL